MGIVEAMEVQPGIDLERKSISDEFEREAFLIAEQTTNRVNLSRMTTKEETYRLAVQKIKLVLEILEGLEARGVLVRNDEFRGAAESLFSRHMQEWLNLNKSH